MFKSRKKNFILSTLVLVSTLKTSHWLGQQLSSHYTLDTCVKRAVERHDVPHGALKWPTVRQHGGRDLQQATQPRSSLPSETITWFCESCTGVSLHAAAHVSSDTCRHVNSLQLGTALIQYSYPF